MVSAFLKFVFWFLLFVHSCFAYEVEIRDTDYSRQVCSGMWTGRSTYINVTFDQTSQGQLAVVIYEWADAKYLGKVTNPDDDYLPKTYVCTARAVTEGFCTRAELGHFILDLPEGKDIKDTSFWSARLELPANRSSSRGFWNNPEGNPTPPSSNYTSPWRRTVSASYGHPMPRQNIGEAHTGVYPYHGPIHYSVKKTGYYCVAAVPVTVQESLEARAPTDVPFHPSYSGRILFKNAFNGKLPATDYPKVNFYFVIFLIYTAFGGAWGWLCYRHMHELLPIQYYLSGLVALLVIEMFANWGYYRYLNAHGKNTASTVFLIVVAILDAARNSMSFFMLLVVSLGLSVFRESLGRTMLRCQVLAGAHFIFGILYAVGIVELELESTSALVLLLFVIPLAFTLSGFLLWIMYSLNATIAELRSHKQHYKLKMFQRLYYILIFAVLVIAIFFVVSSMSFSGRFAEDYAAKTWRVRWWLLDGWLALLYLVTFASIASLWRPTANNRRLAMSEELAQDETDAQDYDLESLTLRHRDDDDETLVGRDHGAVADNEVVFEIGDDPATDNEDEGHHVRKHHLSSENQGPDSERQGLMGGSRSRND